MRILLVLALAILLTAQAEPAPFVTDDVQSKGARGGHPIRPIRTVEIGDIVVVIEKSSLQEVTQRAGVGEVSEYRDEDDAHNHGTQICYVAANATVLLRSDAEMGGGTIITEFHLRPVSAKEADGCVRLKNASARAKVNGILDLSSRRRDVYLIYGPASSSKGARVEYEYRGVMPGDCAPYGFDVSNWVTFKLIGDRIITIEGGQITSC